MLEGLKHKWTIGYSRAVVLVPARQAGKRAMQACDEISLLVHTVTQKTHSLFSLKPSFKIALESKSCFLSLGSWHEVFSFWYPLKISDLMRSYPSQMHILLCMSSPIPEQPTSFPYQLYLDFLPHNTQWWWTGKCLLNLPALLYCAVCLGRLSIMDCINWLPLLPGSKNDLTKEQKWQ